MPVRIYALAKELNIDNKRLVDICTKAGITGKGSALASLSDEEVATLKAFLAGPKGKADGPAARGGAATTALPKTFRREDYIAPGGVVGGKVPVLPGKPERPAARRKPGEEAAPPKPPAAPPGEIAPPEVPAAAWPEGAPLETTPQAALPEAPPAGARPQEPEAQPPWASPPPLGPLRTLDKKKAEKKSAEKKTEKRAAEKGAPAIHLAPLPAAQKPPTRARSKEPAPQKPDLKLPLDAIRAGRAGATPLSEHLRKHEQRKKEAEDKKGGPRQPASMEAELLPPLIPPLSGRERPRRAARPVIREEEEGGATTLGGREQRQLKRKRSATAKRRGGEEEESPTGAAPRRMHIKRTGANTAAPRKGKLVVPLPVTIRTLSEAIGVPAKTILAKLLALGTMSNIAATLDAELAELLAVELGVEVEFRREVNLEDKLLPSGGEEDDPASLVPRPPIVTFLGHVDHGKTSLLDRIIGIDVASKEKGGITQHIRAYRVEKDDRAVTFVDTPGHEAFTAMRARGANVTDIAVLVVAADDGVMPQTEEAISHARAAEVPIVVALNKIDLPGINVDRIYQQLAVNELLPSQWGGETELVQTSAVTGTGIDELLETLLTVAELHEYKANPQRPAQGTCLEAEMQEDRGVVAKLLVQNGTLRVGDVVVCGAGYGRVKAMYDTLDPRRRHEEAGPSTPVNVTGLGLAPGAGDRFYVLADISQARELAQRRADAARQQELSGTREHVTLENLFDRLGQQDEVQTLNIILRADVRGSIEAIRKELTKLEHPEVQIKILQATVGGITEADVHLADASDAVIIGFNVVADEAARSLAERLGVQVRRYDIIYQVTEDLRAALEGMLRPEKQEKELGRALVQRVFHISRVGAVAGCRVLAGNIQRDCRLRVIRESRIIGDYGLESLKREKDDAREVREGMECGMKLAGFNDVKEGDILEAYKIEEVRRTFEEAATT